MWMRNANGFLLARETLRQLVEGPVREIQEAEKVRATSDLSPEAFAIFWILNREGIPESERVARQMASVLVTYPHWQVSEAQEREVRKEIYWVLIRAGVEDPVPLANRILRMFRRVEG